MNRIFILLILVCWVSLTACAQPEPAPAPVIPDQASAPEITILAVGDSLTEGLGLPKTDAYPAQLEAELKKRGYRVTVLNAGVSGETSSGLKARADWLARSPADIVILCSGANDAFRGISPELTKANLASVIETFQKTNATIVFAGMIAPQNNGPEYTGAFQAIYPTLAQEYDLTFIPFFLTGVVADPALNQADQIHPTKEGYAVAIEKNILPVLLPLLDAQVNS